MGTIVSIFLTHVSTPKQKKWHVQIERPSCNANRYEVVDIIDGGVEVLEALCKDERWHIK
jgi:hypothetical protein